MTMRKKLELFLIDLKNMPIFDALILEEAILRNDTKNYCLLNAGSDPTVVLGISSKEEEHLSRACSFPVIRRYTGGGSVVVDRGTLFVSFICNASDVGVAPFPRDVMAWTGRFWEGVIPGFSISENDYVVGEKKFGGNAQYLAKERFVHHTSMLWDFDEQTMAALLHPPKSPAYRKGRDHGEFLMRLRDVVECREELLFEFEKGLEKYFDVIKCTSSSLLSTTNFSCRLGTTRLILQ